MKTHLAQAMVEFALVIPLIVLLILGIFDLGRAVYAYNVVASAAREGAHYGTLDPANANGIRARAINTSVLTPITVTIECSDNGTWFDTVCNTSRKYIRVTVTHTFQPVTLLFNDFTLAGRSTMAIEP